MAELGLEPSVPNCPYFAYSPWLSHCPVSAELGEVKHVVCSSLGPSEMITIPPATVWPCPVGTDLVAPWPSLPILFTIHGTVTLYCCQKTHYVPLRCKGRDTWVWNQQPHWQIQTTPSRPLCIDKATRGHARIPCSFYVLISTHL